MQATRQVRTASVSRVEAFLSELEQHTRANTIYVPETKVVYDQIAARMSSTHKRLLTGIELASDEHYKSLSEDEQKRYRMHSYSTKPNGSGIKQVKEIADISDDLSSRDRQIILKADSYLEKADEMVRLIAELKPEELTRVREKIFGLFDASISLRYQFRMPRS